MKLAVITNFELLGAAQAQRWNRLGALLEERDVRLLLLSTNLHPELLVAHLQIPYAFREFRHLKLEGVDLPGEDELVAVEEHWIRDFDEGESRLGGRVCRAFYERLLALLEPDFIAVWNPLFPHSRLVQLLAEERDMPVFAIERGFLPHTMMLDRSRNNVDSELNNSFAFASLACGAAPAHQLVAGYRRYFEDQRLAKYEPGTMAGARQQQEELERLERPLLLFLDQAHGGGIYPRASRAARRNFAHFESIEQVLKLAVELFPQYQLAFRAHPINGLENAPTEVPEGVLRLQQGTLGQVLPHADAVVVLGSSTALYEALLLDIPLVVVGDSPLGRFGAYVRCADGDLRGAVEQALDTQAHSARAERATAALGFILQHFLIAETDGVPVPQGLEQLADFVASYNASVERSLEERFEELNVWAAEL